MYAMILATLVFVFLSIGLFVKLKTALIPLCAGAAAAALVILVASFTIVTAGHAGAQVTLGSVNMVPLGEGVHLINPLSAVVEMEVRLVKETITATQAGTKDLQQVHTDVTINYRLNADKVAYIYKDFGRDVADKVLVPAVNEAVKSVTAKYTSEELITKRDEVSANVLQHIKDKVSQYDININSVSMSNFAFSAEYQKSIEAKVIATQNKLKAEQDLQRIEVEARQAIATAEGKAKAIQIETAAINSQGGTNYVQLKTVEKWDGKLPTTMAGSSTPFINLNK